MQQVEVARVLRERGQNLVVELQELGQNLAVEQNLAQNWTMEPDHGLAMMVAPN